MKEGRKPEYPEKTPDNELQKNATYSESRRANRYTTRRPR